MPTPKELKEKPNGIYPPFTDQFPFNEMLERISDAFVALDNRWCYTYVNKKAGEIFGHDPKAMTGKNIWTDFQKGIEQSFYKVYHEAMEKQQYFHVEEYYYQYDLWLENHIYPSPEGLSIFFRDITEKKKTEEAMLESKRRYQTLAETCPVGIFHTDAGGQTTYVNTRWCKISGLSFEEAMGNGWLKGIHKDDKKRLIRDWQGAIITEEISLSEYRFVRPDGAIAWVIGQATPEMDSENRVVGYIGTITDITERKKAEEEIANIHKENETVLDRINDAVVSVDNEWRYTFLNDAALATHPLGRKATIGKVIWDVHPEMIGTLFWDKYHEAMKTKKAVEIENYYVPMDIWFSAKVYPSHDGLTIIYKNITERKKAEEALNQNRAFIESIINASPDIIYIYDIQENKNVYTNEGIQKNLGYNDDDIKQFGNQVLTKLMHPEDFDYYLSSVYPMYANAKDQEVMLHKFRIKHKDGEWHWLYCKESIFLRNSDKTPIQIFGIATDVTEQKKAEQAIAENEEKYRMLVEQASDAIFLFNYNGNFLDLNTSAVKLSGYTRAELLERTIYDLAADDNMEMTPFLYKTLQTGDTVINERKYKRKDGIIVDVEISTKLLTDGRFQSIARDITDRKKAEQQIVKEKELSDSIINSLPGIFYLYDLTGKFLRWNRNFETISGYSRSEIERMHPLDFFCAEEKDLLRHKIAKVFEEGEADVEACLFTKTKEKINYYFNGYSLLYEDKSCLIGMGIDITEIKEAEKEIKQTSAQLRKLTTHLQNIRDEERKRIGREIHDELGQQLTAIKMDVAWIDKKIPEESSGIKTKLKNIIMLLDTSNMSVRKILNELRADILETRGLKNALEWQAHQFTANTGIPLLFKNSEIILNVEDRIANCIFRVFQEALTNITKYAETKRVVSSLSFKNKNVILEVEDYGKGFDIALLKSNHKFGILGIKERVTSLNGKFDLASSPGKGTKIIITIPAEILQL